MPEEPMDENLRKIYRLLQPCFSDHGFSDVEIDNEATRAVFKSQTGALIIERQFGSDNIHLYGAGGAVEYAKQIGYAGKIAKTSTTVQIAGIEMTAHKLDGKSLLEKLVMEDPKVQPSVSGAERNSEELGEFKQDSTPGN